MFCLERGGAKISAVNTRETKKSSRQEKKSNQMESKEKRQPDVFTYSISDSPLHLVPWIQATLPITNPEKHKQKRTREFFKYLRSCSNPAELKYNQIMINGESIGDASIWYVNHHSKRRKPVHVV